MTDTYTGMRYPHDNLDMRTYKTIDLELGSIFTIVLNFI